jgi:2-dehydro-3-deoxyphosphogluconate aldolase/(4S)-4-hydroxy-2-oxoglutarate aldolase
MDILLKKRVVPICVLESVDEALHVAEALLKADLPIIEITLRTAAAFDAVAAVKKRFDEMLVGAGTIITIEQVGKACEAGAQFGVSPGLNSAVVQKANDAGLPFIPGVQTPSEVENALALGCRLQKFFPAELAGGAAMLKAFVGPYASTGVRFIPLGGVNMSNVQSYLALPIVAAIGGSWLVQRAIIESGNWKGITKRVEEVSALVS